MKLDVNKALITAEVLAWTFIVTTFALNLFGFEVVDTTISNPYILQFVAWVDGSVFVRQSLNILIGFAISHLMYSIIINNYFSSKKWILLSPVILAGLMLNELLFFENILFDIILSSWGYFIPLLFVRKLLSCVKIMVIDNMFIFICFYALTSNIRNNSFLFLILILFDYLSIWFLYKLKERRINKCLSGLELDGDFLKKKLMQLKTWLTNMLKRMRKVQMKMKKHGFKSVLIQLTKELGFYIRHDLTHKFKRKVLPHVIVYGLYLGYAVVVDKVLQAIFLYVAYVCFYRLFPKHFHADYIPGIKKNWITRTCVCLSALMLCTALHNVIGGGLSVMSSIVVAFIIDVMLYILRDWLDRLAEDPKIQEILNWFNREEKFKKKLHDAGFNTQHINIAVLYYVKGVKMQQVADELNYSLQTCKNYWKNITDVFPKLKKNKTK